MISVSSEFLKSHPIHASIAQSGFTNEDIRYLKRIMDMLKGSEHRKDDHPVIQLHKPVTFDLIDDLTCNIPLGWLSVNESHFFLSPEYAVLCEGMELPKLAVTPEMHLAFETDRIPAIERQRNAIEHSSNLALDCAAEKEKLQLKIDNLFMKSASLKFAKMDDFLLFRLSCVS